MRRVTRARDTDQRELRLAEICILTFAGLLLEILQARLLPAFLHVQFLWILTLYFGWYAPPLKGGMIGMLLGISEDYISGLYLGLNGLAKSLLGFGAHYLSGLLAPDIGLLRTLFFITLAALDRLFIYFLLRLLSAEPRLNWELAVNAVLTGVAAEIFFRLYDKIRFPPRDFSTL